MSKPNYKQAYKDMIEINFKEFNIDEEDIKNKIKNFCIKFPNFKEEDVRKKIGEDGMLKAWFIKDPGKQNIYEKTFLDFLRSLPNIEECCQLPSRGDDAKFLIEQKIIDKKGNEDYIKSLSIKSLDIRFKFRGLKQTFYVVHKYTAESGGAQDNQKNDVKNTIDKGRGMGLINEEIFILFVCDGEYYTTKIREEINSQIGSEKNFKLLNSEEILPFLNDLVNKS